MAESRKQVVTQRAVWGQDRHDRRGARSATSLDSTRSLEKHSRRPGDLRERGRSTLGQELLKMRLLQLTVLLCSLPTLFALKTGDWKTCSQSAFCRRGRALSARAKEAGSSWKSPYSVDPATVSVSPSEAAFSASVKSSIYPDIKFKLDLQVLQDGVVRVRMDETGGLRKRYDETASWSLIADPKVSSEIQWTVGKKDVRAVYGDVTVIVELAPLRISMLRDGKEEMVLNGGGLLHMEHFRSKEQPKVEAPPEGEEQAQEVLETISPAAWFEGEEDGWWEETFKSWTDSKPKGESLASLLSHRVMKHAQDLSRFLLISTFPIMDTSTVFLNTQLFSIFQRLLERKQHTTSPTGCTTPTSSNTLHPRPCPCTVPSHFSTRTLPQVQPSASCTSSDPKPGSMSRTRAQIHRTRTGSLRAVYSTPSSCRVRRLRLSQPNMHASREHQCSLRSGRSDITNAAGTTLARMMFVACRDALTKRIFLWMYTGWILNMLKSTNISFGIRRHSRIQLT